jgi:signal transduction histidine kinase
MKQTEMIHVEETTARPEQMADVLEGCCEDILEEYERRLRDIDSPLLAEAETREQLKVQARAVIRDAVGILRGQPLSAYQEDSLSRRIGISRASSRFRASESLRAGVQLFDSALLLVVEKLPPDASQGDVAQVASAIQRSMMYRIARAWASYNEHLLRQVHESHTDERRRISRELHDRVANSLAVVHQNLGLYETLRDGNRSRAEEKLRLVRGVTQDALASARELSAELRRSVVREGLEVALSNLIPAIVPRNTQALVSVKGDEALIPDYVKDELFLILREALRNAVAHSKANQIRIELSTDPCQVYAAVFDDGQGFNPGGKGFAPGTGIEAMKERAHLLGGTCDVLPESGAGTRVEVWVPLERGR